MQNANPPIASSTPYPIIILEGPDGAGKSTTAKWLQQALPSAIYMHFGPPQKEDEIAEFAAQLHALQFGSHATPLIVDRLYPSAPIYGSFLRNLSQRQCHELTWYFTNFCNSSKVILANHLPSISQVDFFLSSPQLEGIDIWAINAQYSSFPFRALKAPFTYVEIQRENDPPYLAVKMIMEAYRGLL